MSFEAAVHSKAIRLDTLSLQMCAEAGSGHPTTAMSLGQIVTVLMYHSMRWVPEDPGYPTSDRLVLSAGHVESNPQRQRHGHQDGRPGSLGRQAAECFVYPRDVITVGTTAEPTTCEEGGSARRTEEMGWGG